MKILLGLTVWLQSLDISGLLIQYAQKIKIWQLNQRNTDATESNITNGNRDSKIEEQG